jgi:hypothetical protein
MPAKLKNVCTKVNNKKQTDKKTATSALSTPDDSASHDPYGTEKWRRDFEERMNR